MSSPHTRRSKSPSQSRRDSPRRSSRSNSRSQSPLHVPNSERSRKDVKCRSYAQGTCYRGNACWYLHDDPEVAAPRDWESKKRYFMGELDDSTRREGDEHESRAQNDGEKRRKHETSPSPLGEGDGVSQSFKPEAVEEGARRLSSVEVLQPTQEQEHNRLPEPEQEEVLPPPTAAGGGAVQSAPAAEAQKPRDENRSLKVLRNAVTEAVKELLKPAWKEGRLSKEAFKTVAQKAVEKVMGTLQGHEIPRGQAKVAQFMESSQHKIWKLVQGYLDKYAIT